MPYCVSCGTLVPADAAHCPNCGTATAGGGEVVAGTGAVAGLARRTDGQAIASLVLGIAGLVVCPLILSIVAIVLGNQAKARIAGDPSLDGEGLARAGVVLGWIGVGLASVGIVIMVLAIAFSVGTGSF